MCPLKGRLYWSLALALAKIQPFFQIWLRVGSLARFGKSAQVMLVQCLICTKVSSVSHLPLFWSVFTCILSHLPSCYCMPVSLLQKKTATLNLKS